MCARTLRPDYRSISRRVAKGYNIINLKYSKSIKLIMTQTALDRYNQNVSRHHLPVTGKLKETASWPTY
jgi:hypothetical protein